MIEGAKVTWKMPGIYKGIDPEKVWEELQTLGEDIRPEEVVEFARDENTELHLCFEWDDSKAAEEYRVIQAQRITRSLVYQPKAPEQPMVRVLSISSERGVYKPTLSLIRDEDEYSTLLRRAYSEWTAFKNKYSTLISLKEAMDEMDAALSLAQERMSESINM